MKCPMCWAKETHNPDCVTCYGTGFVPQSVGNVPYTPVFTGQRFRNAHKSKSKVFKKDGFWVLEYNSYKFYGESWQAVMSACCMLYKLGWVRL